MQSSFGNGGGRGGTSALHQLSELATTAAERDRERDRANDEPPHRVTSIIFKPHEEEFKNLSTYPSPPSTIASSQRSLYHSSSASSSSSSTSSSASSSFIATAPPPSHASSSLLKAPDIYSPYLTPSPTLINTQSQLASSPFDASATPISPPLPIVRDALSPLVEIAVDELEDDDDDDRSRAGTSNGVGGEVTSPDSNDALESGAMTGAAGTKKERASLKTSKRAVQNRAAQRAFRERKEKHMKELETKAALLDQVESDKSTLLARVAELEKLVFSSSSPANVALQAPATERISLPPAATTSYAPSNTMSAPERSQWAECERAKYELELEVEGLKGSLDESRRICAELRRNLAALMREKREREAADQAMREGGPAGVGQQSTFPVAADKGGESPVKRARVWE